ARPRLQPDLDRPPRADVIATPGRPWHGFWPPHLSHSLDYPRLPAWSLLEQCLPRFGSRVAVRELDHETLAEGRTMTYEALFRAVRGAAAGLAAHREVSGERIAVCLPNSAALIIGYYAVWHAGGTAVPINPSARASEAAQQLADAGVSLAIAPEGSPCALAAAKLGVPLVTSEAFREMEASAPARPATCAPEDDVAVLLYTGGTTG